MNIPAWRILEKTILKKNVLTFFKTNEYRTEISLYALPLLIRSEALRHIERVADYRSTYGCRIRIPDITLGIQRIDVVHHGFKDRNLILHKILRIISERQAITTMKKDILAEATDVEAEAVTNFHTNFAS